jgi:hypothetical protein
MEQQLFVGSLNEIVVVTDECGTDKIRERFGKIHRIRHFTNNNGIVVMCKRHPDLLLNNNMIIRLMKTLSVWIRDQMIHDHNSHFSSSEESLFWI